MSYYIRDGVDLKEVPLHKVETLMNAGITIISDKDIIKELKQQLEDYKQENQLLIETNCELLNGELIKRLQQQLEEKDKEIEKLKAEIKNERRN